MAERKSSTVKTRTRRFFLGTESWAFLRRASVCGADLSTVEGLTYEQITPARGDQTTRLPDGLDERPAHWLEE